MENTQQKENISSTDRIWTKDFTLIVFANFFIFLGFQMTLPTIPLYLEELGGNDQLIGLVIGIFTLSALIVRPLAGHALESKGRAFVYLTGIAIFILSVGAYAIPMSIFFIFMIRIVQGVGWGLSTTASSTIATDLIPAKRRGEGLGYFSLAGNLALAFGPTLGLTLAGIIPFYLLFIICAFLGIASLISSTFVKYKKTDKVIKKAGEKKWDLYEKSAVKPSVLILFITVTFGGIATFLPLYTFEKGITGIQWYFLLYAAALMIARAISGRIYDRKGHRAVYVPGAILILTAMLFLAWLPNNSILFTAAIIYGLGFGTVQPALQAWAVEKSHANRRGMANATFFSFFDLGIGLGAMLFGQISHLFGYQSIYITAAFSVLISIIIYLWISRTPRKIS